MLNLKKRLVFVEESDRKGDLGIFHPKEEALGFVEDEEHSLPIQELFVLCQSAASRFGIACHLNKEFLIAEMEHLKEEKHCKHKSIMEESLESRQ